MSPKLQRIGIIVIGLVTIIGSLGAYFLVILQNSTASSTSADTNTQSQTASLPVDTTAFTVTGPVTDLKIDDLKVGDGAEAKAGDTVTVHYKGTFAQTGQKFDSSYDRGEPVTLSLNDVIEGWQKGIPGMKVGGKRRLLIPSGMAYGPTGSTGIPANTDLVFEVELLAVNPAQ